MEARVYDDSTNRTKGITNTIGNTTLSSYSYTYDHNGNRTSQTELQNGIVFTTTYQAVDDSGNVKGYDSLDRLSAYSVNYGNIVNTIFYGFDGYNRKTEKVLANGLLKNDKTYNYDSLNRLASVVDNVNPQSPTTVSYAYDDNGNTTRKTDNSVVASVAETDYSYDSLNRLVKAAHGDNVIGLYDYDDNNLRIRQQSRDRGDVVYYHDGHQILEEQDAADNSLLRRYSYTDGPLSMMTPDGSYSYYHRDALGSTVDMTDDSGNAQVAYVLTPYGQIMQWFGESANRQIFTGKEADMDTGLIYFGQRYYDADTARFITEDSYLGKPDTPPSLHRYLYAYSNPTVYIDLEGHQTVDANGNVSSATQDAVQTGNYLLNETKEALKSGDYGTAAVGGTLWLANGATILPTSIAFDFTVGGAYNSGVDSMAGYTRGDWKTALKGNIGLLSLGLTAKFLKPTPRITVEGNSSGIGHKGSWVKVNESMSDRARNYQTQITGREGESYIVDGVKFDGVKNGTYLDAKGPGYAKFVNKNGRFQPWWRGSDSLVSQAERQLAAAHGAPVRWHFAEQKAADAARKLLLQNNIKGITIEYTPVK